MKFYIYISDAKVDMLFPQVPHDIKKKVALEFKMDLKLLSASRKTETETEDNRIARLETVVDFIQEYGNVGSVDEPDQYVADTLPMRWGPYEGDPESGVVYFGGETPSTVVGLGGSIRHVVGKAGSSAAYGDSLTPFLMSVLAKELGMGQPYIVQDIAQRPDASHFPLRAVESATLNMTGPQQSLEFLAKRLLHGGEDIPSNERHFRSTTGKQSRILLGSPLYVAMAD